MKALDLEMLEEWLEDGGGVGLDEKLDRVSRFCDRLHVKFKTDLHRTVLTLAIFANGEITIAQAETPMDLECLAKHAQAAGLVIMVRLLTAGSARLIRRADGKVSMLTTARSAY